MKSFLLLSLVICSQAFAIQDYTTLSSDCVLNVKDAEIIKDGHDKLAFKLDIPNSENYLRDISPLNNDYVKYRNWVFAKFEEIGPSFGFSNYNPLAGIQHHKKLIENSTWMPIKQKETELRKIEIAFSLANTKTRRINCLEFNLHEIHNQLHPLSTGPTEFCARVLVHEGKNLKRIYFNSDPLVSVGASCNLFDERVNTDISNDWTLEYDIHNHPFSFSNPYGDFGPIIPSDADLENYKNLKVKKAIITNGLDSFEMNERDYLRISGGITKSSVDELAQNFQRIFADFALRAYDGNKTTFEVINRWDIEYSPTSRGAGYYTQAAIMGIYIGGWVSQSGLDLDGIEGVFCHELGHHFYGGHNEQKADYFTTSECLRKLWGNSFSEKRALSVIKQFESLRRYMLKNQFQLPKESIDKIINCRTSILKDGILGKPFAPCDER